MFSFYEFFAGGGMARAGLGRGWRCTFANDFDETKAAAYFANWREEPVCRDVALVQSKELPGTADLAWASFPCQDLSLAGNYRGLGRHSDEARTRSGTFWPFWKLIQELRREGRAPATIVLENVYGTLTSKGGADFAALCTALAAEGYRFGALVIDAKHFVPQSRQRLFILAVRQNLLLPSGLCEATPSKHWHPASLLAAHARLPHATRRQWVWWKLPVPKIRAKNFIDLIEENPTGVLWDTPAETQRILAMMSDVNRAKVREVRSSGRRTVGGLYKRTRMSDGVKMQRAEVRFDDVAGCLRTPRGGSSRQRILVVDGETIRSRLLSPREAARLMGLPDSYKLPENYNDAYHLAGDGVVVDVVRHLKKNLIEPVLNAQEVLEAAE